MNNNIASYNKVIIIGAPRSGTNMLRDILCSIEGVSTWPCDEINYIWRHGNIRHQSDEFTPEMANSRIAHYIQKQFDWVAQRHSCHTVVEKTCASSLRVPFIERIIPDAKYIFIRRNGLDVVDSAAKRWTATLDLGYIAAKARFVPLTDLPYYGSRYIYNRLHKLFTGQKRLAFWGPQLDNMNELLQSHTLEETCALQWEACVNSAASALSEIPSSRWTEVAYEEFVSEPFKKTQQLLDFLKVESDRNEIQQAVKGVRHDSVGKGRSNLDQETVKSITDQVGTTLTKYGYI